MNVRLDKNDQRALTTTIVATGMAGAPKNITCLAFSRPDPQNNRAVHAKANEQLLETIMRNQVGHCIHVTGEMRALADPFHRRLCAELAKKTGSKFTVIYDIPEQFQSSPAGVGKWNARTWKSKSWADKLSAMNIIGNALVDVRALNTLNEIQYSVFGNCYVLLQEKHADDGMNGIPAVKRVWFLDSEELNSHLTERALQMIKRSKDVPESLFQRFSAQINGITAQNILHRLAQCGGTAPTDLILDSSIRRFDPDVNDDLEALKVIGFIEVQGPTHLRLTSEGTQYLEANK